MPTPVPTQTFRYLSDVLFEVLPKGTLPKGTLLEVGAEPLEHPTANAIDWNLWTKCPFYAADLFAFCAHLINLTGAMGYLDPYEDITQHEVRKVPRIGIKLQLDACKQAAQDWRRTGTPSDYVEQHWNTILRAAKNDPETNPNYPVASISFYSGKRNPDWERPPSPLWWESMFCLLIIADEACDRLGHFVVDDTGKLKLATNRHQPRERVPLNGAGDENFLSMLPDAHLQSARLRDEKDRWDILTVDDDKQILRARRSHSSLTMLANPAVIAVQPKGRVTAVGCSVRNLSRNLSAVGPTGPVRCNWQQLPSSCSTEDFDSLNLLLIPIPYRLRASNFRSIKEKGQFSLNQRWLQNEDGSGRDDEFVAEVAALVKRATDEGEIHGVILPELAINHDIFVKLHPALFAASGKKLKFLISGSSSDCNDDPGNMVLTAIWEQNSANAEEPTATDVRYFSQRKHQRWRIDEEQIKNYALGSALSTSNGWWEDHEIGRRELHFFQLRSNTVFASLICEDMARNDPCHDIVRSVAPNLVFALLMDGPQLPTRWPARYAGALADDPGCTVLSFTSYALVGRSNSQSPDRNSNSVGLLRDSTGATHEIALPKDKDAILISLSSSEAKNKTMDGRETRYASRWKFVNQMPIRIGLRDRTWASPAVD